MNDLKAQLPMALMASLTLGLAPFLPEPHIFGKIRWLMGGGVGMQTMDWFDLAMHGVPWVWLLGILVLMVWRKMRFRVGSPRSTPSS